MAECFGVVYTDAGHYIDAWYEISNITNDTYDLEIGIYYNIDCYCGSIETQSGFSLNDINGDSPYCCIGLDYGDPYELEDANKLIAGGYYARDAFCLEESDENQYYTLYENTFTINKSNTLLKISIQERGLTDEETIDNYCIYEEIIPTLLVTPITEETGNLGYVKIYTDQGWKNAIPYVYTGSQWKEAIPYIFNGTTWKIGIS